MNRVLWLRAQGYVPHGGRPSLPTHSCVICDKMRRPDQPEYVAVWGHVYQERALGFYRWYAPKLDIRNVAAEDMQDHIRHICTEHGDRWAQLPDCHTGEMVQMSDPPSTVERAWRDARYWAGTVGTFLYLLAQECAERAYVWFRLKRHSPRRS